MKSFNLKNFPRQTIKLGLVLTFYNFTVVQVCLWAQLQTYAAFFQRQPTWGNLIAPMTSLLKCLLKMTSHLVCIVQVMGNCGLNSNQFEFISQIERKKFLSRNKIFYEKLWVVRTRITSLIPLAYCRDESPCANLRALFVDVEFFFIQTRQSLRCSCFSSQAQRFHSCYITWRKVSTQKFL